MNLLEAVKSESLETIQKLIEQQGMPIAQWKDYAALNLAVKEGRKDVALYLLQQNCRVNKTTKSAATLNTPLHKAVKLGDKELVIVLLDKQASISAVNSHGNSPLHLAFLNKYSQITNVLLTHMEQTSKYVNVKNKLGLTHLHIACTTTNVKAIAGLINTKTHIDDAVSKDSLLWPGYAALNFAVEYESIEAVGVLKRRIRKLTSNGHCDDSSSLALKMIDQKLEDLLAMSSLLSPKKPFIKQFEDTKDATDLHRTFYEEESMDDPAVDEQLAAFEEYKKNYTDLNGLSHLHVTCTRDRFDLVDRLLFHGADVNARVSFKKWKCYNFTPLHFAVMHEMFDVAELLIKRGADVNTNDDSRHGTPLHIALKSKKKNLGELLLRNGADVAVKSGDDKTTLHALVDARYRKLRAVPKNVSDVFTFGEFTAFVELLVDRGVDANARDSQGDTALHLLCSQVKWSFCETFEDRVIRRFVELGADVELRNKDGKTAVELMCSLNEERVDC